MRTHSETKVNPPKREEVMLIGARPGNLITYYSAFIASLCAESNPAGIITTDKKRKNWELYLLKYTKQLQNTISLKDFDFKKLSCLENKIESLKTATVFVDFYHNNDLLKRHSGKKILKTLKKVAEKLSVAIVVVSHLSSDAEQNDFPRPNINFFTSFDMHSIVKYVSRTELLFRPEYYQVEKNYPEMLKKGCNLEVIRYKDEGVRNSSAFLYAPLWD